MGADVCGEDLGAVDEGCGIDEEAVEEDEEHYCYYCDFLATDIGRGGVDVGAYHGGFDDYADEAAGEAREEGLGS